jgi:hypothetical protein
LEVGKDGLPAEIARRAGHEVLFQFGTHRSILKSPAPD